MSLIHLKDVNKTYQGAQPLHVLKGIDLDIERGEFVSIMGASGSGKSTLLNILGILDNYDTGEYRLNDVLIKDLSETRAAEYRNKMIGFIFQSFNLISFKTAVENVELPLFYQGVSRKKRHELAMEYLDKLGLKQWANHYPNEMSGGQKQRVAIARALITKPEIILADGVKLSTVEIPETKGIAPQTTKMVKSDALKYAIAEAESEHGKEEITVNFAFASDGTEPLIEKGQVMARQQFVINEYQFDKVDTPIAATSTKISGKKGKLQSTSNIEVEETNSYVKVSAKRMSVTIGKKTGLIDYLDVDGEPILKFRESMKPEFWRAPTDNDYGASLQKELKVWKNPVMNLKSFDKSEMKDSVVLTATFEMPEVKAELVLRYRINAVGEVSVTEKMTTDKAAKIADLFRYGMVLDLPASFSKLEYYGRGPEENYIDRHSSTFIGKYESDVKDEYYPYIRPQESGNHTDIRYFSIFNPASGKGITFEGYAPMECSAIPYSIEDLDSGDEKEHAWGQHSGDLVDKGLTQVHIQQRQYGLGCIDSWMTKPMEKYRMHYGDREFRFVIKAK